MIELLSPAGGLTGLYAAINQGADAVYLGLSDFSARQSAVNFSWEELEQGVSFAKLFGVKVYCTVNTLLKDGELPFAEELMIKAHNMGVDAFIVQDFFFAQTLKKKYPQLVLHLSTQAGVCNVFYAKLAKKCGFSRVVLSRELPLKEIAEISKIIETEVFVQGALCTCFSGHCYFSSFAGKNSGNRGRCKQPCRKKYSFLQNGKETQPCYAISLADLSVGSDIHKLIEAGVTSFKIEGRMRRDEYTAAATKYYRDILDRNIDDRSALSRVYNRGDYTKGYLFGQDKNLISKDVQNHKGIKIGTVASVSGRKIYVKSRHAVEQEDGFKILRNGTEVGGAVCKKPERDAFGFYLTGSGAISAGDDVYITTDVAVNRTALEPKRRLPLSLVCEIAEGSAVLTISCGDISVTTESKEVFPAQNCPLHRKEAEEQLQKTAGEPVELLSVRARVKENLFMTKSALNALRRAGYEALFTSLRSKNFKNERIDEKIKAENGQTFVASPKTEYDKTPKTEYDASRKEEKDVLKTALLSDTFAFPLDSFSELIFAPRNYADREEIERFFQETARFSGEKYLYLPPFFTTDDAEVIYPYVKRFYGIFAEGLYGAELALRLKMPLFLGEENNIFNQIDEQTVVAGFGDAVVEKYCYSKELSLEEMEKFSKKGYVLSVGAVKLMQLCYCPFGKKCKTCQTEDIFTMKDEDGRLFPIRRYRLNGCRFEVYNNAKLNCKEDIPRRLAVFLTLSEEEKKKIAEHFEDASYRRDIFGKITNGHLVLGVE